MSKYRVTFSKVYNEVNYDWDESPSGVETNEIISEDYIVRNISLSSLLKLKEKAGNEDYGKDVYDNITIEEIKEEI